MCFSLKSFSYVTNSVIWVKFFRRATGTTIILDALPTEKYAAMKLQAISDPDLCLEEITNTMKTIFINHFKRSLVPKRSQESYRESRDSGRAPTINGQESVMTTSITYHNYKRLDITRNITMVLIRSY